MTSLRYLGLACLLATAPLGAQTMAAPALPVVPAQGNTSLTGAIMQRLTDDALLRNVSVTASVGENGAVSLNGVVPNQDLDDRAIAVVKSVPGVTNVTSQILVNQDPFAPAPATSNAAPPAISAAPQPPTAASEPQALIADALAKQPDLARVLASVYGSKIILAGSVTSDLASHQAEQVVHQVDAKLEVVNTIWIDRHPQAPPPQTPHS